MGRDLPLVPSWNCRFLETGFILFNRFCPWRTQRSIGDWAGDQNLVFPVAFQLLGIARGALSLLLSYTKTGFQVNRTCP
jgi:hypothetical protein